jgi:hypothetical protein
MGAVLNQMTVNDLLPIGMLVEVHAAGNQWNGCEGRILDYRTADYAIGVKTTHGYGVRLDDYGITLTFNAALVRPLGSTQRGGGSRLL